MNHVIKTAQKWYRILNFPNKYDDAFKMLTEQYPALPQAEADSYVFGSKPEDGGKNLLMCLYFCEALSEKYREKGIPEKIMLDSLTDIVLWTNTHHELTGRLGVSETNWLQNHYAFRLFRLGRLQFMITGCARDIPRIGVQKGETVLDVHIPRGTPLADGECSESFAAAKAFFARYFPQVEYKCFTCFSWLLDNTLEQFVRPDGNILKFQKRFQVLERIESINTLQFTVSWGITKENMDTFTPESGFAKRVLEAAKKGVKFYIVFGYIEV